MSSKPVILIARPVFADVVQALQVHFEVTHNQDDAPWTAAQLAQQLQGKAGLLATAGERVDQALLDACPQLRICANMAVGFNNLDLPAMTARGIVATNTPDVLTEATADFGFALLMAAARSVTVSERYVRAGQWQRWRYDLFAGGEVHGTTLGILGMGRIGQAVARRGAQGFGMPVIYHNRSRLPPEVEAACGASYVSKDELLRRADHLVLTLPYTPQLRHSIGAAELALMQPSATLINIARGGIVDEAALAQALRSGHLAAAALDVFENEPQVPDELLDVPNLVLTPHIASATVATRRAMAQLAADNLIAFFTQGHPLTPLNPEVLGALAAKPGS